MVTAERVRETAGRAARTTLAVVVGELRFVLGTFGRAFLRAGGVVTLLTLGWFSVSYLSSLTSDDDVARASLVTHVFVVGFLVGYSLFLGAQGGLVLALPWTAWRLAGPWVLVPVLTIPVCVVLALVICWPLTDAAGRALWDAILVAGAEHDWLVAELGPIARAGPIALLFALPLLVIDLGALMLDPWVLWQLLLLILALALALLLGLVPSGVVSLVAVTFGYVRRFVGRHGETIRRGVEGASDAHAGVTSTGAPAADDARRP
ncbi:MAG: hypothetical protein M3Y87_36055 [Myxococcota bacterium]|nr:hypothetical protein [Myxococcota bacterium]